MSSRTSHRRFLSIAGAGAAVTALLIAPATALAATAGTEAAASTGLPMAFVLPFGLVVAFVAEMVVLLLRVGDNYES